MCSSNVTNSLHESDNLLNSVSAGVGMESPPSPVPVPIPRQSPQAAQNLHSQQQQQTLSAIPVMAGGSLPTTAGGVTALPLPIQSHVPLASLAPQGIGQPSAIPPPPLPRVPPTLPLSPTERSGYSHGHPTVRRHRTLNCMPHAPSS
ncbi:unnamed protein product [Ceratitis capitata]|uniref:(Mediterranean fruit fly) hypothetical protein n=1 Tax=Ceratitis capitata TaxID=7213 RepID=A0A811V3A3_CERCA|nr:unnamed protein product [Ceratitis capitata]